MLPFAAILLAAAAAPSVTESFRPLAGTPGFRGLRRELQRTVDRFGQRASTISVSWCRNCAPTANPGPT